jgi:hypothetical protein
MLPVMSTKIRTAGLYRVCLNYPSNCSSGWHDTCSRHMHVFSRQNPIWRGMTLSSSTSETAENGLGCGLSCRWAWASTPAGNRQNKNTQLKTLLANCTRDVWTKKHVFICDMQDQNRCEGQIDVRYQKKQNSQFIHAINRETKIPSPNRRWAHNQKRAIWEC